MVLSKIYTKTGDGGETSLGDGSRVPKDSLRVDTYGTVDELNSCIGMARLCADSQADKMLAAIQNDLFDLGADLCVPESDRSSLSDGSLRIVVSQVKRLETEIDQANSSLEPLRSFVLPGGSEMSSRLHQCRTVARRAERCCVGLSRSEQVNPEAVRYLNRLSDWFFVMARMANDKGTADVLWVPGANRE